MTNSDNIYVRQALLYTGNSSSMNFSVSIVDSTARSSTRTSCFASGARVSSSSENGETLAPHDVCNFIYNKP